MREFDRKIPENQNEIVGIRNRLSFLVHRTSERHSFLNSTEQRVAWPETYSLLALLKVSIDPQVAFRAIFDFPKPPQALKLPFHSFAFPSFGYLFYCSDVRPDPCCRPRAIFRKIVFVFLLLMIFFRYFSLAPNFSSIFLRYSFLRFRFS